MLGSVGEEGSFAMRCFKRGAKGFVSTKARTKKYLDTWSGEGDSQMVDTGQKTQTSLPRIAWAWQDSQGTVSSLFPTEQQG